MSILAAIKQAFMPEIPTLRDASAGLCVLPMPAARKEAPKQPKAVDLFVIDKDRNVFGFNSATAVRQTEGSVPALTQYDIDLLVDREYWGKGKEVQNKNARCKQMWHSGSSEQETASALGVGESWVEKRFGTFATALSMEQGA